VGQAWQDLNGEAAGDYCGTSVALLSYGVIVAAGAIKNGASIDASGHTQMF